MNLSSAKFYALNLEEVKILSFGKGLTFSYGHV